MKLIYLALVSLIVSPAIFAASLKTDKAKISYAIGQQIGSQIKQQGVDIDVKILAESISDAVKGKKSQMDSKQIMEAMNTLRDQAKKAQEKIAKENLEKGEAFLKKNKKAKGVKVTDSGLQYKVIKKGKGKNPKATNTVKVHYKGTLIDGSEFDSSYKRNQPAEFPLNRVIPGWTEGLQLMKPGAKYMFYIPSKLAYGPSGRPSIPPNSTLIFEVELLEIKAEEKEKK